MDNNSNKFYCSPYIRSIETIKSTAEFFKKKIITDFRFREREKGENGNVYGMFELKWADNNFNKKTAESR